MDDYNRPVRGAGGTPGGLLEFLVGGALIVAGGYLFLNQVSVVQRPWFLFGRNGFGLSMIPLLIGIALLFFNGRSLFGWALAAGGMLIIFLGVITNLDVYFRGTSLFNTLLMLGMLMAGLGLVARALRPH